MNEAQTAREAEMKERGRLRARSMITKAIERGEAAETPAGVQLLRRGIEPLEKAIKAFLAEAFSGKAVRHGHAANMLKEVDPAIAAYVTIKVCLSWASRHYALKTTALNVASLLEMELIADAFEQKEGALYRAIVRNAKNRGLALSRQGRAVMLANQKFKVVEKPWTQTQRLHLGIKLVELMIESTGLVRHFRIKDGRRTKYRMELTPKIDEWMKEYNNASTLTRPVYLPMVVPPKPWTDIRGGAYWSPILTRYGSIVTRPFNGQLQALQGSSMPTVYGGLNGLQETPWRVNKRVLEVMQRIWDRNLPGFPTPRREDMPLPEAPPEVVNDVVGGEHRKAWRRKLRNVYEGIASNRSARFEFDRALSIAAENAEYEAIYFPHRLDFRGRAYAAATTLNPQGPDEVRGLLEFAEGKELGEHGGKWLAIHGANLFGEDKISLEEREAWAKAHVEHARSVAQDPIGYRWWTEADKPWCFLAWCFEWADANGPEFVSHMPVALDGTCNGIQHFSALLRDEVGGKAVNLVPGDKPEDIYEAVAREVRERLNDLMVTDGEDKWIYDRLFQLYVDRKITKRPVMVLPYGGTFKSCQRYVEDALKDHPYFTVENFGEHKSRAVNLLASVVWESIGTVVVGARTVMSWLQSVAHIATKHGVALQWTAPSGFVVFQDYKEYRDNQVRTRFLGKTMVFRGDGTTSNKADKKKQVSAVSPNFVHALDASAMMSTIHTCRENGIYSFAMIHDSYGTHAADTERLARILRACFVSMYKYRDVLKNFRDEIAAQLPEEAAAQLPPLPTPGNLNLDEVNHSPYFFA